MHKTGEYAFKLLKFAALFGALIFYTRGQPSAADEIRQYGKECTESGRTEQECLSGLLSTTVTYRKVVD